MRYIALVAALALAGCKMENAEKHVIYGTDSRLAIEAFGFTDVVLTGPSFYGCGNDYTIATEFMATGPRGHKIEGVVCGALIMKGWAVKPWKVTPPVTTQ